VCLLFIILYFDSPKIKHAFLLTLTLIVALTLSLILLLVEKK